MATGDVIGSWVSVRLTESYHNHKATHFNSNRHVNFLVPLIPNQKVFKVYFKICQFSVCFLINECLCCLMSLFSSITDKEIYHGFIVNFTFSVQ